MTGDALPPGCDQVPTPAGRLILTAKRYVADDPDGVIAALGSDTTIVCLNPERELMRWPSYPEWLRTHQPDTAYWFAMPDWNAPDWDHAKVLIGEIVDRLGGGRTVVVHCSHGQGRTGTVAVAVLMLTGASRREAERLVGLHRPGAGPASDSQTELIDQLERVLDR